MNPAGWSAAASQPYRLRAVSMTRAIVQPEPAASINHPGTSSGPNAAAEKFRKADSLFGIDLSNDLWNNRAADLVFAPTLALARIFRRTYF